MSDPAGARPDGSARRRESWSLTTLVEEVSGHPIGDFQDPQRPSHPYVEFHRQRVARASTEAQTRLDEVAGTEPDPIERVYPPLSGATGRSLHGPEHEHHQETLESIAAATAHPGPGSRTHAPGPSRRPERIYLHYLLLHLDRLNDSALQYLQHAVDEELRHRSEAAPPPTPS